MLTRISLHNYNCLVDFELELPRRLLFVGSNGSGKSSLWEALTALQDLLVLGVEVADAFPTRSLTRWQPDPIQRLTIDLSSKGELYTYTLEVQHEVARQLPSLHREQLCHHGRILYELAGGEVRIYGDIPRPDGAPRAVFPFGRKRSFLPLLEPRPDNQTLIAFREALGSLWLFKPSPAKLDPTTTTDEATWLARDGSNFSSWLRGALAERPELGSTLHEALRGVLPGFDKLGFVRVSQTRRELSFDFRGEGHTYSLSPGELSDGQRSLVLLYGLLIAAFDRASLVFIDEPEIGLAPHEIQPWLAQAAAVLDEHEGQLFVSSHHPAAIDYLAPQRTLRFSRPAGGHTTIEEITLESTRGTSVSEWIARPWAYDDEHQQS